MKYLYVQGWSEYQSYRKDRGTPPWIKVHRGLMTKPKWSMLTDAEKGQLVSIWIVAADNDGKIPANPKMLQKIAILDEPPNINKLLELRFLVSDGCQDDAKMTPTGCQDDAPETETETETEPPIPPKGVEPAGLSNGVPDWWDQKSWDEWIHWRKTEKRCRVTQSAANKQFHQIKKFVEDGYSMAEIVDTAIRNDWRGLYAPNKPRSNFNSANGGLVV